MPGAGIERGPLSRLEDEALRPLLQRAVTKSYPKNAIIISEGDKTEGLYIIVAGRVRIFLANDNGKEVTLGVEGPGEYFGEMTLDGGPRSASVVTLEPSRFLVVPRADLEAFLGEHPAFAVHVLGKLIRRVRILTNNVKSLALQDVYGRMVRLLMELSDLVGEERVVREKLTQQDIADRVGSSREMVNRVMKELTTGGYVAIRDGRHVIVKKLPAAR